MQTSAPIRAFANPVTQSSLRSTISPERERSRAYAGLRRFFKVLLAATALSAAVPAFADSVSLNYTLTNVSGSEWEYTYSLTGSLSSGDLLAVYFPVATSSTISDPGGSSSNYTTSVLQPDSSIPADGEYDILTNSAITASGDTFNVLFDYLGTGSPSVQDFALYDSSFATIETGTTSASTTAVTPEPESWTLLALGLTMVCFLMIKRRHVDGKALKVGGSLLLAVLLLPSLLHAQGGTPPTGGGGGSPPTGGGGGGSSTLTGVTIGAYTLQSSYRYSANQYNYVYTTTAANANTAAYSAVLGTVTSSSANTVVVSGTVEFGNVPAIGTAAGLTTFTIRQDRRYAFTPSSLSWSFTGTTSSSTVGTTPSTVALNASQTSISYGTAVDLAAAVSPTTGTGTVTFYDGSTPLGTATVASGAATLSSVALPTGTHTLSAVYGGDTTYASSYSSQDPVTVTAAGAATSCSGLAEAAQVACLATAFETTLTSVQLGTLQLSYTLANVEHWSNLPLAVIARNGLQFSTLTSTQLAAAQQLAQVALSAQGYQRLQQIRGADSVIATVSSMYEWGSGNYFIAFYGTPSATSPWMLQINGHHFAFNHTYNGTYVSGTPYFIGTEPEVYNVAGTLYFPMEGPRAAAYALTQSVYGNSSALLSGTFDDVVHGIDSSTSIDSDYPAAYPTGTTGRGVLYSALTQAQQSQVKAVIEAWVNDMDSTSAAALVSAYEDSSALASTYVGYSGDGTLAVQGDYIRVDGPRVWIELVVQNGVAYTASYHFHSIWRDKTADYGGEFSSQ